MLKNVCVFIRWFFFQIFVFVSKQVPQIVCIIFFSLLCSLTVFGLRNTLRLSKIKLYFIFKKIHWYFMPLVTYKYISLCVNSNERKKKSTWTKKNRKKYKQVPGKKAFKTQLPFSFICYLVWHKIWRNFMTKSHLEIYYVVASDWVNIHVMIPIWFCFFARKK